MDKIIKDYIKTLRSLGECGHDGYEYCPFEKQCDERINKEYVALCQTDGFEDIVKKHYDLEEA